MGMLFADIDGFPALPPVTRLQCLMNVVARTQRDLARFHQEVREILAAHPELKRYVSEEFKKPPRLVIDNAPPRRGQVPR
jgi:hypothetical protein